MNISKSDKGADSTKHSGDSKSNPAKSLPYVEAIKQGYRVLTKEQRILYQPNLLSRRKFILEATPPKGHWAYHDTTK